MIPFQNAAYAPTKLVLHWLTKAIHMEEPELTAFPIDPGWVQTDIGICAASHPVKLEVLTFHIGNHAAHSFNIEKATLTLEESVSGMIKVIDVASRDSHGGKLWDYKGEEVPW
jgi:NAD(P)-dependent dehydrogenase (short-subunit alcohol dehydrogenase family)